MSQEILVKIDSALEDLIPGFLENMNKNVGLFREALAGDDIEFCRSRGHNLKGSGGGYGFDRITEIGKVIENAAKAGDKPTISQSVDELEDYLNRVKVTFVWKFAFWNATVTIIFEIKSSPVAGVWD